MASVMYMDGHLYIYLISGINCSLGSPSGQVPAVGRDEGTAYGYLCVYPFVCPSGLSLSSVRRSVASEFGDA